MTYQQVWQLQRELQQGMIKRKRSGDKPENHLLFCEHEPVFTIGKSGKEIHWLGNRDAGHEGQAKLVKVNRGGDITYHGPGQITGYPIFDMDQFYHDLHRYVRDLEEVIIQALNYWQLRGQRIPGLSGVWLTNNSENRKICAIGVHMSRWVSMHGFAFNVNTNLDYYQEIIPCGIADRDKSVTSLYSELGYEVPMEEARGVVKSAFESVFELEWI